jgi:hypothetical protein
MSTYFYELLAGKPTKKYTENPMTTKILPEVNIDETYIVVKNVVDKLSGLIIQPYDYVKKYIIKKNEDEDEDEDKDEDKDEDFVLEEISLITISYDTIYKAEQHEQTEETDQTEDNIDAFVKTVTTAYTFVLSTYNDATT